MKFKNKYVICYCFSPLSIILPTISYPRRVRFVVIGVLFGLRIAAFLVSLGALQCKDMSCTVLFHSVLLWLQYD